MISHHRSEKSSFKYSHVVPNNYYILHDLDICSIITRPSDLSVSLLANNPCPYLTKSGSANSIPNKLETIICSIWFTNSGIQ